MSELQDLQAVELDILKAVVALCEKYNLTYTLYCGTLLGAVRHKGFIPWDDDIDLAMPLKDYRRFRAVANELPAPFVLQDWDNCSCFCNPWLQIRADGTTHMDLWEAGIDKHHGIWIDIYPFIGASRTRLGQIIQDRLIYFARVFHSGEYHKVFRNDKRWYIKLLVATPKCIRLLAGKLCFKLAIRDPEKSRNIGTVDAAPFSGKFEKKDWDRLIDVEFEGSLYSGPEEYDKVLHIMYGNYMVLPPESQRKPHGSESRIINCHKDYREYQKELRAIINSDEILSTRPEPQGTLWSRIIGRI